MRLANITAMAAIVVTSLGTRCFSQPCAPDWDFAVGQPGTNGQVEALTSYDDGSGPALYVGGLFTTAGGVQARNIARWDGVVWAEPAGGGMGGAIRAFHIHDDGSGHELYAGGAFMEAGGAAAHHVAKWDGASWTPLGLGTNGAVSSFASFDDGAGPALYVGGHFTTAGGIPSRGVARWRAGQWSSVAGGLAGAAYALAVFDDGSGPALYVGSNYGLPVGPTTQGVAKWNGTEWSPVGGGLSADVTVLISHDDGSGPALYAAVSGAGSGFRGITRWNGTNWSSVGGGLFEPGDGSIILAAAEFNDNSGETLYVGGYFPGQVSGMPANNVARWTGSAWAPVGPGLAEGSGTIVRALAGHSLGTQERLIVGGDFEAVAGVPVGHLVGLAPAPLAPASIQIDPFPQSVPSGEPAMFHVTASGSEPLSFRWRRNQSPLLDGGNIAGAFTPTLTIDPARFADRGIYDIVVSNACATVISDPATLAVSCPGDASGDGIVNFLDLNIVLGNYGMVGPGLLGDVNGDGVVNFTDLNFVLSGFGRAC